MCGDITPIMKIALYFRNVSGGIKTHVDMLEKQFKSLGHKTKIIDQNTLGSHMLGDFYGFENGAIKIKKEILDCDILHIHHGATFSEFLIPSYSFSTKISIINTFHIPIGGGIQGILSSAVIRLLARRYSKNSRAFISVSSNVASRIKKYNKTMTIPNGVDIDQFYPPSDRDYDNVDSVRFGYLGRLSPEKNVLTLIKAADELGIELSIAGGGPLYEKVKSFESERIKVLGYVDDASDFLRSIDVFLLPSHLEAQPIVLLEAMASGLPVIATDVGDNRYFVEENGVLCGTSEDEIKTAIKKILNEDLVAMGKKSREIAKMHTWRRVAEETIEVYKMALK